MSFNVLGVVTLQECVTFSKCLARLANEVPVVGEAMQLSFEEFLSANFNLELELTQLSMELLCGKISHQKRD